jgi:hypothetical protein
MLVCPGRFNSHQLIRRSAANAENAPCFTLASLQGSYAVIGTFGANLATALGAEYLDGNGNLTRNANVNQPTAGSTTGARTLTTTTNTGTYIVNCDGTGTFTRVITQASGSTSNVVNDFVITGATVQRGQLIATTIVDAQETPSVVIPGGIFVTFVHTRLPDRVGPPQL